MDFDVMRMIITKSAGKTLADRFASCENIVWISFKRMYGKWLPPPPPPLGTHIAHQCCDQMTAVKTGYPLTSIT